MTLQELLNVEQSTELSITATKNSPLSQGETEKIERIIGNMSNGEKTVAVRKIPTEILQNEITRRIQRDKANLRGVKAIIDAMEDY